MIDRTLFLGSLKDICRAKRLIALLLFALVPTILGLVILSVKDIPIGRGEVLYNGLVDKLVFGFVLVMIAAITGTGALAQEIERKTIVYLLTRPVARWRIGIWRLLAALVVTMVVALLSLWLCAGFCFGSDIWHSEIVRRDTGVLMLGSLSYTCLFFLLGAAVNRPLIYAIFFAFGWESWVPNMPGNFAQVSLMSFLRALAPHDTMNGSGSGPGMGMMQMMQEFTKLDISSATAHWVLWGAAAICAGVSLLVISQREYCPKDDGG